MLGWRISVYRQLDGGKEPAPFGAARGEARLAVWQTGLGGLDWLDELAKQRNAIDLGGDGYPNQYTAMAQHLRKELFEGPPYAKEVWSRGESDIVTPKWPGKTLVDRAALDACGPTEWLIIEAWDES